MLARIHVIMKNVIWRRCWMETSHLTVEMSTNITCVQNQIYERKCDSYKISKYLDIPTIFQGACSVFNVFAPNAPLRQSCMWQCQNVKNKNTRCTLSHIVVYFSFKGKSAKMHMAIIKIGKQARHAKLSLCCRYIYLTGGNVITISAE